jgi:DnaJ like chaperone protein
MLPTILLQSNQTSTETGISIFGIYTGIFIIIIILMPFVFFIKSKTKRYWESGIFPPNLEYNRKNLLEAYICLSANMILKDKNEPREKVVFIQKYFKSKFPFSYDEFSKSLSFAYQNSIETSSITNWITKHISNPEERKQILYFLVGLSLTDGELISSELKLLTEIRIQLGLDEKELDSILAMHIREERETSYDKNKARRTISKTETYCKILEVNKNATFEDIKKSYRRLAMLNHPDKFQKSGEEMLQLANERFLKIQEAYTYLEGLNELMNKKSKSN